MCFGDAVQFGALVLDGLAARAFLLGGFVLGRVPHRRDELDAALFAFGEAHAVRRLDLEHLASDGDQVLGAVGEEDALGDVGDVTVFAAGQLDGVGRVATTILSAASGGMARSIACSASPSA